MGGACSNEPVEPRDELAEFLRTRRAALRPEAVGLPSAGRRRTPGLRREEVALLAGVSVSWYTWLEQGRPIRASRDVLVAIARTLQLNPTEHAHLLALADRAEPVATPDSDRDRAGQSGNDAQRAGRTTCLCSQTTAATWSAARTHGSTSSNQTAST